MKRGPTSAASLAVISGDGIVSVRRPTPPAELTDEQAEEWRAIVNRLAADWFPRETHPLLAQYCRHIVTAKHIAQLISKAESDQDGEGLDLAQYDKLLQMQEREGRAAAALARAMRLTQQTTYSPHKTKQKQASKPWLEAEK